jgi:hypothetical protein
MPAVGRQRRAEITAAMTAFAVLALFVGAFAAMVDDPARDTRLAAGAGGGVAAGPAPTGATTAPPGTHGGDHHDGTTPAEGTHGGDHVLHESAPGGTGAPHDGHTAGTHPPGTSPDTSGHGGHPTTPTSDGSTPTTGHDHGGTTPTTSGGSTPTTGHHHGGGGGTTTTVPYVPVQLEDLPADLQALIGDVTAWAMQYPTAADAAANGYPKLTMYFPGLGAHYIDLGLLFDNAPFDPARPETLLYGGDGPDAQLVGINYIVYSGTEPPAGFAGTWDVWHEHPSLCLVGGIVIGEQPAAECQSLGGTWLDFSGFWLLHVWSIPGWEAPEGIFSHENSRV